MEKMPKGVPAQLRSPAVTPRQMTMVFDNAELQGMNAVQRARAISHLASLLIQAAGTATGKESDDGEL